MEISEILDDLIEKGENLSSTIEFVPSGRNVIRFHAVYRTSESENYQNWMSASKRFIKSYYPSDLEEFKEASNNFSPGNHKAMLGILRAIKMMPIESSKKSNTNIGTKITINNTQQLTINIIKEVLQDELTGKQFKELKEIVEDDNKDEETKKTNLKDKIKNMGSDVMSNIIANILTNPNLIGGIM